MPASIRASCATPRRPRAKYGLDTARHPGRARPAPHGRRPGGHDRRRRARSPERRGEQAPAGSRDMTDIGALAADARRGGASADRDPAALRARTISLDDAYAIQPPRSRAASARGETRVGMKMGFTSRAKMVQMGVDDMIWGRLTDAMLVEDGGTIEIAQYVHPRVEPEVAFLLKAPLDRHGHAGGGDGGGRGGGAGDGDHRFALQGLQVLADRRGRRQLLVVGLRRRRLAATRQRSLAISAWSLSSTAGRCRSARRRRSSAIRCARSWRRRGCRARGRRAAGGRLDRHGRRRDRRRGAEARRLCPARRPEPRHGQLQRREVISAVTVG